MLTRRHINVHDDDLYVMCETGNLEMIDHLFFYCTFAHNAGIGFIFNGTRAWSLEIDSSRQDRSMACPSS
jgi:hypothetical protein